MQQILFILSLWMFYLFFKISVLIFWLLVDEQGHDQTNQQDDLGMFFTSKWLLIENFSG